MKDRTINVRETLWDIVLSWRRIILCGVIGALLFSMAYYVKNLNEIKRMNADSEPEISRTNFTPDELDAIDKVLNMYTKVNVYQEQLDHSLLIQAPVTDIKKLSLLYYVDVPENSIQIQQDVQASSYDINLSEEKQENSIMALYAYAFNDMQIYEKISKVTDLDIAAIQGLIGIQYNENILRFTILYTEDMKIDEIIEIINNFVIKQDFSKIIDYEVNYIDTMQEMPSLTEILDYKEQCLNDIYNIRTEYAQQFENLSAVQQKYVNYVISSEARDEQKSDDNIIDNKTRGFATKYIFTGILLGALIVCLYAICRRIFSSTLIDEVHIDEMYDVKVLGMIVLPHKKHFLSKIDKLLLQIKDRRKRRLTDEQKSMAAISSMILECEQQNIKKLCVTGTRMDSNYDNVILRLSEALTKNDIEMKQVDNIMYGGEGLKDCVNLGHVVILEQMRKSLYDEISNEIKKLREHNICIVGALIMD